MLPGPPTPDFGTYRLRRVIGAGGMATVHEAEDLRHRRPVAIKRLRSELCRSLGEERFLREIETIANLRHPHILPLFDSGSAEGELYYVMPLVEEGSLRTRLERRDPMPVDDAIRIAREVADALQYAHDRGVIHRDIKPENILLASGHAVLSDFGIAMVSRRPGSATITGEGIALGTPQYLSPEQAMGERDLDGRSDVYSLACVLYEMLAGRPPFVSDVVERYPYLHMVQVPAPVTQHRPDVPLHVSAALQRALAKDPGERFPSASAFANALVTDTGARTHVRVLAVLPFLGLGADPDVVEFADGITEDVIAQLSKVRALKVLSRASVMPFRRREIPIREVAERLAAGALLDGSVRRAGSRVRIVAQLVDAATERTLWSGTWDRDLTDIFAIQAEVALQIAAALQAELSPEERHRIDRRPVTDVRAYQLYLQGRQFLILFSPEGFRKAIETFDRALAVDAEFAPAHSGKAMAYIEWGESGDLDPEVAFPSASTSAHRAVALDPELAEAHCTVAFCRMAHEYDWSGAEAGFTRAAELNPSSADTWDLYGRLCSATGRYDEAIDMQRRAHELDPLAHRLDLATAFLRAGRPREAAVVAEHAVEFDPQEPRGHATLAWARLGVGRIDEGLAALAHAHALAPDNPMWYAQLGAAYAWHGRADDARRILSEVQDRAATRYVSPYHLAYIHTALGEQDRAMDYLEVAFEKRSGAIYGIRGSFLFRSLQEHPRFQALLRRMRLS